MTSPTGDVFDAPEGYRGHAEWSRHIALSTFFALILLVSQLVVPQLLAFWMFGEQAFQSSAVIAHAAAAVSDGERIWVPITRMDQTVAGKIALRAYDFDGQPVKDLAEISIPGVPLRMLGDGPRVWLLNGSSVLRVEGGRVMVTYHPRRAMSSPSELFLHKNELAVIDRDSNGDWELLRLRDGEWVNHGYLVPPGESTLAATPSPVVTMPAIRNSSAGGIVTTSTMVVGQPAVHVGVSQSGIVILWHELASQPPTNSAWFATELPLSATAPSAEVATEGDAVSAAAPVNTINQAAQGLWKSTTATTNSVYARSLGFLDHQPVTLALEYTANHLRVVARSLAADAGPFAFVAMNGFSISEFATIEHGDQLLIVTHGFGPSGISVRSLGATIDVERSPTTVATWLREVPAIFWSFYAVYFSVMFALLLLMLIGFQFLMSLHRTSTYAFGAYSVQQGSFARRGMARLFDTLLFWLPLMAFAAWGIYTIDIGHLSEQFGGNWTLLIQLALGTILGLMIYTIAGVILWGVFEGLFGWSPGKLLCGLRVIRTTFEPLGLFRGIVRQICLIADGFFMGLVGSLLIAVTPRQQRLGDWVADSIVVDAQSLDEQRRAVAVESLR